MDREQHSNTFSLARVRLLAKRTLLLNQKSWLTGLLTGYSVLAFLWLLPILNNTDPWHNYNAAALIPRALILFHLGGYIMTSRIFSELHSSSTAFLHLTLPATAPEKIFCAWIITGPLYTAIFLITFLLFANIIQPVTNLFTDQDLSLFWHQLFTHSTYASLGTYLTYQPIFLLGAVVFKKNQFIKTAAAIIITGIFLMFAIGLFYLIMLSEGTTQVFITFTEHPVYPLAQTAIGLFMLVAATVSLKNKQIT